MDLHGYLAEEGVALFVALKCEARSLVERLQLIPKGHGCYRSRGGQAKLWLTGAGQAGVVRTLQTALPELKGRQVVNFGIGGHRSLSIGRVVVGKHVSYEASGQVSRTLNLRLLQQHAGLEVTVLPLRTVDTPTTDYPTGELYDMEAFHLASGLARQGIELSCLKVVSDNRHQGVAQITSKGVAALMQRALWA